MQSSVIRNQELYSIVIPYSNWMLSLLCSDINLFRPQVLQDTFL
jgi:hypothetical protein